MPVKGKRRYIKLLQNIQNPGEYLFNKGKRTERELNFVTKPNAISFPVPESLYQVFKEIFMEDVYDIGHLLKRLPPNPVVIDIGANAGFFDILLLSKIRSARIFAYEPLPSNTAYIEKVMEKNPFMKQQVSLHQKAVTGTEKDELVLYMEDTEDNQVVASVFDGFNKENLKKTVLPAISLTKIITENDLQKIDLLKMDCEGSEYDILRNSAPEILNRARFMSIEVHDVDDKENNFASLKKYLEGLHYSLSYAPINNFCYAVEAVKQD
ncbi:MAG: FkbM family methyltransferase [Ferruginibacter sp.]